MWPMATQTNIASYSREHHMCPLHVTVIRKQFIIYTLPFTVNRSAKTTRGGVLTMSRSSSPRNYRALLNGIRDTHQTAQV